MIIDQNAPVDVAPAEVVSQPQAPVVQPVPQPVAQPQPTAMSERAKQEFEKLLESNKKLFEESNLLRQQLEQQRLRANQYAQPVQPTAPAYSQPAPVVDPRDFVEVDPISGEQYINDAKLRERLNEVNERASRAEMTAKQLAEQMEQREIDRQNREAFQAYPELNPDAQTHNKEFHKQVRAAIYDSLINPQDYGNRPLTFKEAADFVRAQIPQQATPVVQPEAQAESEPSAIEEARALKAQGSVDVVNQPAARENIVDAERLARLRQATRYGDDEALARRLMGADHKGFKPTREEY